MRKSKEVEFMAGDRIDDAVKLLQKYRTRGQKAHGFFNRAKLTTKDNLWSAYRKVTGKSKPQWDKREAARSREYEERKRAHEAAIPALTEQYIKEGAELLGAQYHSEWARVVPIRLSDLYEGKELRCCLDIIKALNDGADIQEAVDIIDGQGHSGMSHSLVRAMVRSFCDRGEEFFKAAR